jgi:hypothetical protein
MSNHVRQSAPPAPYDPYRGLPMAPGGAEPLIFQDRVGRTRSYVRPRRFLFAPFLRRLRQWLTPPPARSWQAEDTPLHLANSCLSPAAKCCS